MALKSREKMLVGAMLVAGGLALIVGVGLPQFDALMANVSTADSLKKEIETLENSKQILSTLVATLEKKKILAQDIIIRRYNANNLEEVVKSMLDQVVGQATDSGMMLISLEPYDAPPFVPPPPPESTEKNSNSTQKEAETEQPATPPLQTFGYELAFRGNYNNVLDFLRTLDTSKELVEISSIKLLNEAGETRTDASAGLDEVPSDPTRPLKLTTKIRLVLQPEG